MYYPFGHTFHQHLLARPQKDVQSLSMFLGNTQLPIVQLGKILEALFQDENVLNKALPKRTAPSLINYCFVQEEASSLHATHLKVQSL